MAECTRCQCTLPTKPPHEGRVNKALLRREIWRLRFNMHRFRWMPDDRADQVRMSYTELQLCSDCATAVFLFARGRDQQ